MKEETRRRILEIYDYKCGFGEACECSKRELKHLTMHHIIRKSEGGNGDLSNFIPLGHTDHVRIERMIDESGPLKPSRR